jgi:hypothetical protein
VYLLLREDVELGTRLFQGESTVGVDEPCKTVSLFSPCDQADSHTYAEMDLSFESSHPYGYVEVYARQGRAIPKCHVRVSY